MLTTQKNSPITEPENIVNKLEIKPMKIEDLQLALQWAKEEKWNPGKFDYKHYFKQNSEGFFMLWQNKTPVGCIAAVTFKGKSAQYKGYGFIGLFIVLEKYRGKGLGKKLFSHALEHLKDFPIGLNAVPQQIDNYARSGFKSNDTLNLRFVKAGFGNNLTVVKMLQKPQKKDKNYADMLNLHSNFFPIADFGPFLQNVISEPSTHFIFKKDEKGENLLGFMVLRRLETGWRASCYAQNFTIGKELTEKILKDINQPVAFDIPFENTFSHCFAEYFRLERQESADTTPMYTDDDKIDTKPREHCYGMLGLEITHL